MIPACMTFLKSQNCKDREKSVVARGLGREREEVQDIFRAVKLLCVVVMLYTYHSVFISKPYSKTGQDVHW